MATSTQVPVVADGQPSPPRPRRSDRFLARVPGALATLFAVVAWFCVLLSLIPLLRTRTTEIRDWSEFSGLPLRPNLAYAAFVGLVAASLRRRTRVSWWLLVLFYLVPSLLTLASFIPDNPWLAVPAAIVLGLLVLVIAARRQFYARVQKGNGWRALATLVVGLAVASGIGIGLVFAFPGTLSNSGDKVAWAINHVFGGLGSAEALDVQGRPPHVVTFLCGLVGAAAFLLAAWVLFRPARWHAYLNRDQEIQLRLLLGASGQRDSLGYFATRRDKAAVFSPTGKAAITYRVVFGTSLASGDPVGD